MKESYPNIKKFVAIMERFPTLHFSYRNKHESLQWEEVAEAVRKEIGEECSVLEVKNLWKKLRLRYITLYKRVFQGKNLLSEKEYDFYDSMVFLFPETEARHGHSVKSSTKPRLPRRVASTTSYDDDDESITLSKCIQKPKSKLRVLKPFEKNSIPSFNNIKTVCVVPNRLFGEPCNPEKSSKDVIKIGNEFKELNESSETERFVCSNSIFKNETAPIVNNRSVEELSDSERSIEESSFITKTETLLDDPDVPTSFIYKKTKAIPASDTHSVEKPSDSEMNTEEFKSVIKTEPLLNKPEVPTSSTYKMINLTDPAVGNNSVEEISDSERSIEESSFITKTETLLDDPDVPTSFIYKKTKAIPASDTHSVEKPSDSEMNTEDTVIKTEPLLNEPEVPTSSTYKKINLTDPAVGNNSVMELSDSEEYISVIKTEALWNETDVECSYRINEKPMEEKIDVIRVENSHAVIESTSLASRESEENLDMQFFRSILPDIADFAPHEKRKFKMGVLQVIDEIVENRNN